MWVREEFVMKRIVISLVLILLLVLGINAGYGAEALSTRLLPPSITEEFIEDSRPWTVLYRSYFLAQTIQQDNLKLSVVLSVYRSERAADLLAQVEENMRIISAALPVKDNLLPFM